MDLEKKLIDAFLHNHPEEAAQALNGYNGPMLVELLQVAEPRAAAHGLQHTLPRVAADALGSLPGDAAAKVLQELPLDAQLVFLHRLNSAKREALLDQIRDSRARTLRRLLDYPEGSAGQLMDPSPVAIQSTDSIRKVMRHIRTEAQSVRYYIYVVDKDQRLVGVVTLRQLLNAHGGDSVASIMETNVVSLPAMASKRDIIKHPRWKDFHVLPVVDRDDVLMGVIQYETLGRLKESTAKDKNEKDLLGTLLALGELYWLGMTGSLDAISVTPQRRDSENEGGG